MNIDIELLMAWIRVCVLVAAVCTTMFPILYSVSNWRRTRLGQVLMLQAVAFALAMDLTAVFQFWHPHPVDRHDIVLLFLLNGTVLGMIAVSTLLLTVMMWRLNHQPTQREIKDEERPRDPGLRRSTRRSRRRDRRESRHTPQ